MVYDRRISDVRVKKKPKLVLDHRFAIRKDMEIGETGQLEANMTLHNIELYQDEDFNELRQVTFIVNSVKPLTKKDRRT